jgi:ABC-type branched-subunit amino acid transport system substrate-binding protein
LILDPSCSADGKSIDQGFKQGQKAKINKTLIDDGATIANSMSNNPNTVLTIFCIVTLIVCLSSLETNALSAFAQTNKIAMDKIQPSDTSKRTSNGGLSSWMCFTEFDQTCKEMSNASSTYIG